MVPPPKVVSRRLKYETTRSTFSYVPEVYLQRGIARLKRDGTCAEARFGLSAKRTSPFKLAGASVQSNAGSRGVRISGSNGSNAGYTMFCGRVQDYWLPTPLTCFPFTFPTVHHSVPSGFNWAIIPSTFPSRPNLPNHTVRYSALRDPLLSTPFPYQQATNKHFLLRFGQGLSMGSVTVLTQQVPPSFFTTHECIILKTRWKYIPNQRSPIFDRALLFGRFPCFLRFVLPVRATRRWRWVCSIGGIILNGQNGFKDNETELHLNIQLVPRSKHSVSVIKTK